MRTRYYELEWIGKAQGGEAGSRRGKEIEMDCAFAWDRGRGGERRGHSDILTCCNGLCEAWWTCHKADEVSVLGYMYCTAACAQALQKVDADCQVSIGERAGGS